MWWINKLQQDKNINNKIYIRRLWCCMWMIFLTSHSFIHTFLLLRLAFTNFISLFGLLIKFRNLFHYALLQHQTFFHWKRKKICQPEYKNDVKKWVLCWENFITLKCYWKEGKKKFPNQSILMNDKKKVGMTSMNISNDGFFLLFVKNL